MTVVQHIGAQMHDPEFERLQSWFTPKRVRRLLADYHAILDPWMHEPEEERGVQYTRKRNNPEPSVVRLADMKASIDWAMHRLAADDPLAHMVVTGLYVERYRWDEVSKDTGLPVRTQSRWELSVVDVEARGVRKIAMYLGYRDPRTRQQ